jgi:hypothetical protein
MSPLLKAAKRTQRAAKLLDALLYSPAALFVTVGIITIVGMVVHYAKL